MLLKESKAVAGTEYNFQMICIRRTQVIEWRPNAGCSDMGKLYANVQLHVDSIPFWKNDLPVNSVNYTNEELLYLEFVTQTQHIFFLMAYQG
jgi:hypothetical protein